MSVCIILPFCTTRKMDSLCSFHMHSKATERVFHTRHSKNDEFGYHMKNTAEEDLNPIPAGDIDYGRIQ